MSFGFEQSGGHMPRLNTAVSERTRTRRGNLEPLARRGAVYWIMGCETGHITSVWACCLCWHSLYNAPQPITISSMHQLTQTHTDYPPCHWIVVMQVHKTAYMHVWIPPTLMTKLPQPPTMHTVVHQHDKLQHIIIHSHSDDIFFIWDYKHRCGDVISLDSRGKSWESSFCLHNESFCRSTNNISEKCTCCYPHSVPVYQICDLFFCTRQPE